MISSVAATMLPSNQRMALAFELIPLAIVTMLQSQKEYNRIFEYESMLLNLLNRTTALFTVSISNNGRERFMLLRYGARI